MTFFWCLFSLFFWYLNGFALLRFTSDLLGDLLETLLGVAKMVKIDVL